MAPRPILNVVTSWGFLQSTLKPPKPAFHEVIQKLYTGPSKQRWPTPRSSSVNPSAHIPARNTEWVGSACGGWFFPLRSTTDISYFQNGSSGRLTHQQPRAGDMREYLLLKEGTMSSICIYKIMNRNAILADCSDQHLRDMTISIGLYVNRRQCWISTPKRLQNLAI